MKKIIISLFTIMLTLCLSPLANAIVQEYSPGDYETPDGYAIIDTQDYVSLDHYKYYIWGIEDFVTLQEGDSINIVFYDIYNWRIEDNQLSVYIFNEPDQNGWSLGGIDLQDESSPNWEGSIADGGYEATLLGIWEDLDGSATTNNVVFSIDQALDNYSTLLSYLSDGGSWGIGIDPDCHFYGEKITVEAPVPEPATMLLFGVGLVGMVTIGRKRFFTLG